MRFITRIFIHCSAGFGNVESQKAYWKSLGWRHYGYHREVTLDAKVYCLTPYEKIVNGVLGYNSDSISISYTGGVEKNNVRKAKR